SAPPSYVFQNKGLIPTLGGNPVSGGGKELVTVTATYAAAPSQSKSGITIQFSIAPTDLTGAGHAQHSAIDSGKGYLSPFFPFGDVYANPNFKPKQTTCAGCSDAGSCITEQ